MQSASYEDSIVTEFCKDWHDLENTIRQLKYAGTPIKFVDWTKNTVSYYVRGIYGVTYG